MSTAVIEAVLEAHADCLLNDASDVGAAAMGYDIWSCGINMPMRDTLEDAERAHLAFAVAEALLSVT